MEYDLFISYSTIDNRDGRIARLVEELQRVLDFVFGIRPRVYFDTEEDEENDALSDRRERESEALHESAILLACLSPSYLESERCRRQLETFRELAAKQNRLTDILAVDINDVSRWMDPVPDDECCFFISQIRQRQVFDLRLWYSRDDSPRTDLLDLIQEIVERLPGGKATTDFLTAPYDRSSAVLGSEEARSEFVIDSSPSASRRERETVPYASVDQTVSEHQPPDNERATRTSAQEEITDRQSDDVVFTVYRRRKLLRLVGSSGDNLKDWLRLVRRDGHSSL